MMTGLVSLMSASWLERAFSLLLSLEACRASGASPDRLQRALPALGASTVQTASSPAQSEARGDDDMLFVPGGEFAMGSDSEGEQDERPQHMVTLRGFYLDRTEVTQQAYYECVSATVCRPHDPTNAGRNGFRDADFRRPNQPISGISWDDANAYCAFRKKRLPTEPEWERAARGSDRRRYPWGDSAPTAERAVFGVSATADVGTHPAGRGPYGHEDLAGNVWEWIQDEYDPFAYRRPSAGSGTHAACTEILATQDWLRSHRGQGFTGSNPIPTECEHVLRGGAFNYPAPGLRSSNRVHHPPRYRLVMSGVRCARDAGSDTLAARDVPPANARR